MEDKTIFDKIGGRKFIASIIVLGVAAAIEIYSKNGLSTNMAGLLAAVYATFSASNALTTVKSLNSEQQAPQVNLAAAVQPLVPIMNQVGAELAAIKAQQEQQLSSLGTVQKAVVSLLQK
jgi:hypothetical protein